MIPSESSEADEIMTVTSGLASSGALMPGCPKCFNSPTENQKELSRIHGSENTENKTTKVAQRSLVRVKMEEVSDSDDDLLPQLLQVKRQDAKKLPLGTSPSKSNKSVIKSNKDIISKPHYDHMLAQNLLKAAMERQDKPRAKG